MASRINRNLKGKRLGSSNDCAAHVAGGSSDYITHGGNQAVDERLVIGLAHYPDDGLSAGGSNHKPPTVPQTSCRLRDRVRDTWILKRLAAVGAHVAQN